jgi:hypothetical protein
MKEAGLVTGMLALGLLGLLWNPTVRAADISGKWNFQLETDGGPREASPTFRLDGTKVSGKWEKADVKGTFVDDKLDLAFALTSEEAGMTGTLKIVGQMQGDEISGKWEFEGYGGTFKAKRAQ